MKDFKKLQEMDRRMRELAGLYAAEKARADKLEAELRAIRENRAGDVVVAESETTTATCKESFQVGNAAKMCEAVKKIDKIVDDWLFRVTAKSTHDLLLECGALVTDALSTAPRNCDRQFQNAHDVLSRFTAETGRQIFNTTDVVDWLLFAEAKGGVK